VTQLQLPRVDANALRERVRDIDLSRLADLGEELRRLGGADGLKGLDVDALRRLDIDSLRRLDVDALRRFDLDALRHLGDGVERPELDLGPLRDSALVRRVQRALGREPKRNLWSSLSMPSLSATFFAGAVVVLAGAAIGGLVAWLYQPGKGDQRRARIGRRLKRVARKVRRTIRPA
jgi:hypothetical protein